MKRSDSLVENDGRDDQFSTVHAPPSSSRLDHLLSLPPLDEKTTPCSGGGGGGGGQHHHCCEGSAGSPSFASYLLDVESVLLF